MREVVRPKPVHAMDSARAGRIGLTGVAIIAL
jgi:hypothetical protein